MTDLLTIAMAADACHVHPKTVERAVHRGELRASKLAQRGCWVIQPDDLRQWIESRANRPRETNGAPITPAPRAPRRRGSHPAGLTALLTDDMGKVA